MLCEASHNAGQMQMYVNYFDRFVKTDVALHSKRFFRTFSADKKAEVSCYQ
jgi:hypothetical protein